MLLFIDFAATLRDFVIYNINIIGINSNYRVSKFKIQIKYHLNILHWSIFIHSFYINILQVINKFKNQFTL